MALIGARGTSADPADPGFPGPRLPRLGWPGGRESRGAAVTTLRRFLVWWTAALRASLPAAVVRLLAGPSEELEIEPDADAIFIQLRRDGVTRARAELSLPPDMPELASAERLHRLIGRDPGAVRQVTFLLPRDQVLLTEVELPSEAARNLREVLAAEMNRHTPFSAAEVYFDHAGTRPDSTRGCLRTALLVAKRRDVDTWLGHCEDFGLRPSRVTCPDLPAGPDAAFNLLPPERRRAPARLLPRLVVGAAVATFALASAFLGLWYDQQRTLLEQTEARLTTLRATLAEADAVERRAETLVDRHDRLVLRKRARPQALAVIDAVTRSLPDDSWLTALSIDGDALAIEGFSDDPARVLRLMAKDPLFADVWFAGPVQADPRMGQERFRFAATIAPAEEASR